MKKIVFWYDPEDGPQSRSRVQHAARQTEANQVEGILMDGLSFSVPASSGSR